MLVRALLYTAPGTTMPYVSGTEYSYISKTLGELESDLKKDANRSRIAHEKEISDIEEGYREELRELEEETGETVKNAKEEYGEALRAERAAAQEEIKRLKQQLYNSRGRTGGEEVVVLRDQVNSSRESLEEQQRKNRAAIDRLEEAQALRVEDLEREHSDELEQVVRNSRDSALKAYNRSRATEREQYDQVKKEAEQKYAAINEHMLDEARLHRETAKRAIADTEAATEKRVDKLEYAYDDRIEKLLEEHQRELADTVAQQRRSHKAETGELREAVRDALSHNKDYVKGRAEGAQEAYKDVESEFMVRERRARGAYEELIDNIRASQEAAEEHLALNQTQVLREKDNRFTKTIQEMNAERHRERSSLVETFKNDREETEQRAKLAEERSDRRFESAIERAGKERSRALESQATAFQESMSRQRARYSEEVDRLQKKVDEQNTATDPNQVSAAAESAIRDVVTREFMKTFDEEASRNKRTVDSMQREYESRIGDVLGDVDARVTGAALRHASERHRDRAEFLDFVHETESQKELALRSQEIDHRRQNEGVNKNFSKVLDRQKRQFDELLETLKADASAKLQEVRQEAEFESRLRQREFAFQQSELIRQYENLMAKEKEDWQAQLENTKLDAQRQIREMERNHRVMLEGQARSYEQRIEQLEVQQNERERYLARNFEEELDNMRRANARLINKRA